MHILLSKRTKDVSNQRFGSLVAAHPHHRDASNNLYWKYNCDCGNQHIARANTISHQATKQIPNIPSCGCVELANKTKHGYRKANNTHPAYRAYRGMLSRCYDVSNPTYKWYGAKGVTVCNEWKNNPKTFVEWSINNGWKMRYHLDKDILSRKLNIDPPLYSPETCQWVTAKVNVGYATNRSNYGKHPNVKISTSQADEIIELFTSGEETNMSQLARDHNVNPSTIHKLLVKSGAYRKV